MDHDQYDQLGSAELTRLVRDVVADAYRDAAEQARRADAAERELADAKAAMAAERARMQQELGHARGQADVQLRRAEGAEWALRAERERSAAEGKRWAAERFERDAENGRLRAARVAEPRELVGRLYGGDGDVWLRSHGVAPGAEDQAGSFWVGRDGGESLDMHAGRLAALAPQLLAELPDGPGPEPRLPSAGDLAGRLVRFDALYLDGQPGRRVADAAGSRDPVDAAGQLLDVVRRVLALGADPDPEPEPAPDPDPDPDPELTWPGATPRRPAGPPEAGHDDPAVTMPMDLRGEEQSDERSTI